MKQEEKKKGQSRLTAHAWPKKKKEVRDGSQTHPSSARRHLNNLQRRLHSQISSHYSRVLEYLPTSIRSPDVGIKATGAVTAAILAAYLRCCATIRVLSSPTHFHPFCQVRSALSKFMSSTQLPRTLNHSDSLPFAMPRPCLARAPFNGSEPRVQHCLSTHPPGHARLPCIRDAC